MLAGSRRRSKCSCWWIRLRSRPGLAPRPIPVQQRGDTTAPRVSPVSMRLRKWSGWVGKTPRKAYVQPESQQDEEKRQAGEHVRMNLILLSTPVLADRRSLTIHTLARGSHTILQPSWSHWRSHSTGWRSSNTCWRSSITPACRLKQWLLVYSSSGFQTPPICITLPLRISHENSTGYYRMALQSVMPFCWG